MSCIFRISGKELILENLLSLLSKPEKLFIKGEEKGRQVIQRNSANYLVSDADFDQFQKQKQDATNYLQKNNATLQEVMALPGVESACLDFAVEENESFTQSNYFEPELLKFAGTLGIGIELTMYPVIDNE